MAFVKSDGNFVKCGGKIMKFVDVETEEETEPTQETDIIEEDPLDIPQQDINMNLD